MTPTEMVACVEDRTTCPRCGRPVRPGVVPAHRCASPGLIAVPPGVRAVVQVLDRHGAHAYFVGGCVRDAVLGHPPADIDIEVHGAVDLDDLERALAVAGCDVHNVGRSFGVLKVVVDAVCIDVAVPRREVKIGDGHRGFEIGIDHSLDEVGATSRRDFTINALMWDLKTEEIVDAHGGLADLASGVLRHVGPAFAEDPLRVLRAMQFVGRLDLTLHPDTADVARGLVSEYDHLSRERVWAEWEKLLMSADRPGNGLDLLASTGWRSHYRELIAIDGVPQDQRWHPEGSVDIHTRLSADSAAAVAIRDGLSGEERLVLVAAAITHDFGKATHTEVHHDGRITSYGHAEAGVGPAASFLESIGCPSRIVEQVVPLVREHMCASTNDGPTSSAVRRLARRLGDVPIEMWAKVVEADNMGRGVASAPGPAGEWVRLAREIAVHQRSVQPIITGRDLIEAGLRPGPGFRPILAAALAAQDTGIIEDRPSGLRWLEAELAELTTEVGGRSPPLHGDGLADRGDG